MYVCIYMYVYICMYIYMYIIKCIIFELNHNFLWRKMQNLESIFESKFAITLQYNPLSRTPFKSD